MPNPLPTETDVQLIQGDCLDVMPTLDASSVAMVYADLPFGYKVNAWDVRINEVSLWSALHVTTKPDYVGVFSCNFLLGASLLAANVKQFKYDLVWQKVGRLSGHLNANRAPMREHENILVFAGNKHKYFPVMKAGKPHNRHLRKCADYSGKNFGPYTKAAKPNLGTRFPTSIIALPRVKGTQAHPTEKPVQLVEYMIRTYTNDGDTILDPVAGSGTTAIAAMNVGNRKVICIEKDPGYFDVMSKRVAEHQRKMAINA